MTSTTLRRALTAAMAMAMPLLPATVASIPAVAAPATGEAAQAVTFLLRPGQFLRSGQYLRSPNGVWVLRMQTDGNLVLRKGKTAAFATQTHRHPGAYLAVQTNGDVAVYSRSKQKLWQTRTWNHRLYGLAVQNNGNVALYDAAKKLIWNRWMLYTVVHSGVVMRPGMGLISRNWKHGVIMGYDGNLVQYRNKKPVWTTRTQGNKGAFAVMQTDGNLVVYLGRKSLWSSRTHGRRGAYLITHEAGDTAIYYGRQRIWTTGR